MKKKRRSLYQRRARGRETIEDGQDSFLDVVSNLVGILIILVMIAGTRVHDASAVSVDEKNAEEARLSTEEREEIERRNDYVEAVNKLTEARTELERARTETEDYNERLLVVEQQADAAESEYRELLAASAEIESALKLHAQKREDNEQIAFELKSELVEKEKKLNDLQKQKEALEAARPKATVLENLPTPLSQRVEQGREGFFRLKHGKLAYVPINEFEERLRLTFKNYRGDITTKRSVDETIGPVNDFKFHYLIDFDSTRGPDGVQYYAEFRYGECLPTNDDIGEPVDQALASRNSKFCQSVLKYLPQETTITIFVYPDSFEYLNDIKKRLFSLGYQLALRPLPDGAPISLSPDGTASASY